MSAKQQSQVGIFKNTSGIPRPRIDQYQHDARDSAGSALARLLKVGGAKVGAKYQENKAKNEEYENDINAAHAEIGLPKFNNDAANGKLDLITGDHDPDVYDIKRGDMAGANFAGELRDKYMQDGVFDSADPAAFSQWLQENSKEAIAEAKSKGSSYYRGFVKQLGKNTSLMAKQFAGHSEGVIERSSQTAMKQQLKMARDVDKRVGASTALGGWMKDFLSSESSGNWNAWFGNAGNKEDLGQLDLAEILRRQAKPGNDAAGLIQIVPSTLKHVMKRYGYSPSTKFTPQVQTEMALLLMKEKGLDKWLRNEIPDGVMADRLASVWAGLKTSKGKGVYDGDGVNKGHQGHSVTVRQLGELRVLMGQNKDLATWISQKDPKAGKGAEILSTKTAKSTGVETAKVLEDVEGTGVDYKKIRDSYADVIIEDIEKDDIGFGDKEVEDEIKTAKLNAEQAEKVRSAASLKKSQAEFEATKKRSENVDQLSSVILTGEGLPELMKSSPQVAQRVLQLKSGLGDTSIDRQEQAETSKAYLTNADYNSPTFKEDTIKAFLTGEITEFAYKTVIKQFDTETKASAITSAPAIQETLDAASDALPSNVRGIFKKQVNAIIAEMLEDGVRPKITEVLEVIESVSTRLAAKAPTENDTILNKPEYNID